MSTDSDGVVTRRSEEILVSRRISSAMTTAPTTITIAVETQEGTPGTMLPVLKCSLIHSQNRSHRSGLLR